MRSSRFRWLGVAMVLGLCLPFAAWADMAAPAKPAASRLTAVTVYPNTALVTREVQVPEGEGAFELVVSGLPAQTQDSSLYSEGTDLIRILSTRYRMRPIKEDTREEVRKLNDQIKALAANRQSLESQARVIDHNQAMLGKLEAFTAVRLNYFTEKGVAGAEPTLTLTKYIMETRAKLAEETVKIQQELAANQEQVQFHQRQLNELSAGPSRVERDAIITIFKSNPAPGVIRLNYLVNNASWLPQYKFRAGLKDRDVVQVEYLAAIRQQSGEDWTGVTITLSTAQPSLNAAPPDLKVLALGVTRGQTEARFGGPGHGGAPAQAPSEVLKKLSDAKQSYDRSREYREQAQRSFNFNRTVEANEFANKAAAEQQNVELLIAKEEEAEFAQVKGEATLRDFEGATVTYRLASKLAVPSRQDEQVVEVAKIDLQPEFFYKAVPVLTKHVYRVANLTNSSTHVLLPGEATMYIGTDFVGRSRMPLVAIGEQFRTGFGIDPQLQIQRQLVDKSRAMQGANQVLKYQYRILMTSYKAAPVRVQVWDRLPVAESEVVGITLVQANPELSADVMYQREERTKNLLRWDVAVDPTHRGEKALAISYEFKMELDRQMQISGFTTRDTFEPAAPRAVPAPAPPARP